MYEISVPEDSGNIVYVGQRFAHGIVEIDLTIREEYKNVNFYDFSPPEHNNPRKRNFFQWFYFHCDLKEKNEFNSDQQIILNIANAKDVFVPQWNKNRPYSVWACTDNNWHRIETIYNEHTGILTFRAPAALHTEFAFYPPYPFAKHCELIESTKKCSKTILGYSIENRPIHLLRYGEESPEKKIIVVIARQHPGETPAAFFVEGLIKRLENELEPLLEKAVIYIVDNMNPDGTYHGNLRSNAAGIDLNRAWSHPDPVSSPEVWCVRQFLESLQEGDALFFDVHADESHARLFIEGREGNDLNPKLDSQEKMLMDELRKIEPRIHSESCYPPDKPGEGNFNLAVTYMGQNHVSILIEQPFKAIVDGNDWTPEDCKRFGSNLPHAINRFLRSQFALSQSKVGTFKPVITSEKKETVRANHTCG